MRMYGIRKRDEQSPDWNDVRKYNSEALLFITGVPNLHKGTMVHAVSTDFLASNEIYDGTDKHDTWCLQIDYKNSHRNNF